GLSNVSSSATLAKHSARRLARRGTTLGSFHRLIGSSSNLRLHKSSSFLRSAMNRQVSQAREQIPSPLANTSDQLQAEIHWLYDTVASLNPQTAGCVVSHRGFHIGNGKQGSEHARPVENSLPAYELSWSAGLTFCECDVICTRDGKIILNHDSNLRRLGLDVGNQKLNLSKDVGELDFRQVMKTPLRSGVRPPLLTEVLSSAGELGDGAKLVIELKCGPATGGGQSPGMITVYRLIELLKSDLTLVKNIGVIMSFDLYVMGELAKQWAAEIQPLLDELNGVDLSLDLQDAVENDPTPSLTPKACRGAHRGARSRGGEIMIPPSIPEDSNDLRRTNRSRSRSSSRSSRGGSLFSEQISPPEIQIKMVPDLGENDDISKNDHDFFGEGDSSCTSSGTATGNAVAGGILKNIKRTSENTRRTADVRHQTSVLSREYPPQAAERRGISEAEATSSADRKLEKHLEEEEVQAPSNGA
ncbi:unnamed protein product, partial [Amoebophrya sp. A25]